LQFIFDEGKLHEGAVLRLLQEAGIEIVEQQRSFEWREYQITGHIDGKVLIDGEAIPLEIKSASPNSFSSINCIEDLMKGRYLYLRQYPAQMTLYLLLGNAEKGVILFKNKVTGELKEIPVTLDYDYGESLIQKAERINEHIRKKTLPDPIDWDEYICSDCGYGHICLNEAKRTGLEILEDPELEKKIVRREELKEAKKEYEDLDQEVKKTLQGIERAVIGEFIITGRMQEKKEYLAKASSFWVTKIVKIGGETNATTHTQRR
jgi:CRISPR/Cas system-associated exonuclease Cas4 (RecB family)